MRLRSGARRFALQALRTTWDNLENYAATAALAVMIISLTVNVFARFVLRIGVSWADEVAQFALLWTMFLAASLAAKERAHIRVTLLILLLPKPVRRYVIAGADAIWVVFNIFVVYGGVGMVEQSMRYRYVSPVLAINMTWMFIMVPICMGLMTVRIVVGHWRNFAGRDGGYDL